MIVTLPITKYIIVAFAELEIHIFVCHGHNAGNDEHGECPKFGGSRHNSLGIHNE